MYTTDMYEGMLAETITIQGHGGDWINAYYARPLGDGPFPSIVVIHHLPGWDEFYRETTRRFAHHGYAAISPNLYFREGHGAPDDVAAKVRADGGVPDDQVMGDVEGALRYVRSLPYTSDRAGVIGTCSGGRHTFLAACRIQGFDAAVDCWGGRVVMSGDELTDKMPVAPIEYTKDLSCPSAGPVRRGGRQPLTGAGGGPRGGAQAPRQVLRVPHVRRRRPRLLLLRQAGVPRRAGRGRLG